MSSSSETTDSAMASASAWIFSTLSADCASLLLTGVSAGAAAGVEGAETASAGGVGEGAD